jgi:hypothetical protein
MTAVNVRLWHLADIERNYSHVRFVQRFIEEKATELLVSRPRQNWYQA